MRRARSGPLRLSERNRFGGMPRTYNAGLQCMQDSNSRALMSGCAAFSRYRIDRTAILLPGPLWIVQEGPLKCLGELQRRVALSDHPAVAYLMAPTDIPSAGKTSERLAFTVSTSASGRSSSRLQSGSANCGRCRELIRLRGPLANLSEFTLTAGNCRTLRPWVLRAQDLDGAVRTCRLGVMCGRRTACDRESRTIPKKEWLGGFLPC